MNERIIINVFVLILFVSFLIGIIICPNIFWKITLGDWLMSVILFVTGCIVFYYTKAVERQNEIQFIPSIDVNIIYDKEIGKTYFWFSNYSNFPVKLKLNFRFNVGDKILFKNYGPYRISPNVPGIKTSTVFFENLNHDNTELILHVNAFPDLDNLGFDAKIDFSKRYKFNKDKWDEDSFGYPDRYFIK